MSDVWRKIKIPKLFRRDDSTYIILDIDHRPSIRLWLVAALLLD